MRNVPVLIFLLSLLAHAAAAQPIVPTAFTYQGHLKSSGAPASGLHDFQFALFDSAGTQITNAQCFEAINVQGGVFTVHLDFGQNFHSPGLKTLHVGVRQHQPPGCANALGFTALSPRQLLTAAPFANRAIAAYALDAPDGAPAPAVSVDAQGRVGVGTVSPLKPLQVLGIEGIHIGDNPGAGGFTGLTFSLSSTSNGRARIQATQSSGSAFGNLGLNPLGGSVGVGTETPAARLDVRGDIRLGATGELFGAGGGENLRIVRGVFGHSGSTIVGAGFTVTHRGTGKYTINFSPPFTGPPAVTLTAAADIENDRGYTVVTQGVTESQARLETRNNESNNLVDRTVHFIAIGPR